MLRPFKLQSVCLIRFPHTGKRGLFLAPPHSQHVHLKTKTVHFWRLPVVRLICVPLCSARHSVAVENLSKSEDKAWRCMRHTSTLYKFSSDAIHSTDKFRTVCARLNAVITLQWQSWVDFVWFRICARFKNRCFNELQTYKGCFETKNMELVLQKCSLSSMDRWYLGTYVYSINYKLSLIDCTIFYIIK